jgi:hypothetical protein
LLSLLGISDSGYRALEIAQEYQGFDLKLLDMVPFIERLWLSAMYFSKYVLMLFLTGVN